MGEFVKKGDVERREINLTEDSEVLYWSRHFGVTKKELQQAIDKVGNSVSAVGKELDRNTRMATAFKNPAC